MIVALGLPLKVAAIILGCIFSILFSVYNALGPISNPIPPTAALTEFFPADTVTSDHPLPVSWYLISSMCVHLCSCMHIMSILCSTADAISSGSCLILFKVLTLNVAICSVCLHSWRQHPTRLQLYGHLPPITKTIQVRRTRHAGHCWRSKDELISDVLLWAPTHGCASVGRPARTYIQQLCEDTGCNPEDLPEAMSDREKWRETVRDIRADGATWWWWWL